MESTSGNGEAEWLTDDTGEKYLVAKTAAINSGDIESILIEKTSSKGQTYYSITFYFRKEAWNKVYSASKSHRKHRLAVIKGRKLFLVGDVHDVFIQQVNLSGQQTAGDVESFLKGFLAHDRPSPEVRDREYAEWSESYIKSNPDDIEMISKLALYRSTKGDCDKAAELATSITRIDPSRLDDAIHVLRCYKLSKRYERLEEFFKNIPLLGRYSFSSRALSNCLEIRNTMAEIYVEREERQKAINEFEKSLSVLESAEVSIPPEMSLMGPDAENYLADMMNLKLWEITTLKEEQDKLKKTMK